MKFTSRPNACHKLPDGRLIWESRSPAVVGACIIYPFAQSPEILLTERGPACPDEAGKSCMPCGYLDWDESATDGARREVWEEAGILINQDSWFYHDQPWKVNHLPTANKQNVSLHFYFTKHLAQGETRPALSMSNCEPGEVSAVYWTPVKLACQQELAFNHHITIKELAKKLEIQHEDIISF